MNFHDYQGDQAGRNEITLVDRVAASASDSPLMHLTGCTGEERLMIAKATRILAMPEMQMLREMVCTYARWELDNDACQTKYETDEWLALPDHLKQWLIQWEGYK